MPVLSTSTPRTKSPSLSGLALTLSVWVILLGCLAYGYSLDRYPGFYVDDVVFAYPALQAAQGGAFTYPGGGSKVPYINEIWAYHGPVLPNIDYLVFKLFGYSFAASRLPDFLGAWAAALLVVLFLKRRGYRYAGLMFAILWCGDRAVQEIMYGRMDGIALLVVFLAFLCLERAWNQGSRSSFFLCGLSGGFSILVHPLCAVFALTSFLLILYRRGWTAISVFCAGGLLNLPILLILWHLHPVKSWIQFRYVATILNKTTGVNRAAMLISVLRWSRYWFVALIVMAIACSVGAMFVLLRRKNLTATGTDLLLVSSFGLAALVLLARSALFPYYIVYFSVWPMICIVILTERYRRKFQPIAILLALVWCSSAAWNVMRLREPLKFYSSLSHHFLDAELKRDIPANATVVTSSELYSIPIESGFAHRALLPWDPLGQDVCHECYLLIPKTIVDKGDVSPSTLSHRVVLYRGPAFPGAGPLEYDVLILSPEDGRNRPA